MMCLNPMVLHRKSLPDMIVPCGMCRYCRMMRSQLWSMRMMHETKYHSSNTFVTLTYADAYLPKDGNLVKSELQNFIKRVRKEVSPLRIKYFACGEYGEKFGRPHYHLIMFGIGLVHESVIRRCWPFGFIKLGAVNEKSCRYVSKYILKAPLGRSLTYGLEKVRPFQTCSRGLGLSWIMENAEIIGNKGIWYHGRQTSMPRYYVNKLRERGVLSDRIVEEPRAEKMLRDKERYERLAKQGIVDGEAIAEHFKESQAMRLEEVKTKDSMSFGKDRDNQ